MRAAWYERLGPAAEVLQVGDCEAPQPGPGEVLVRIAASGVNPSDWKKRSGWQYGPMTAPRVIPHNDGAGVIEAVGDGVSAQRVGERVWLFGAQAGGRAGGTAAELCAVPADQAVRLPTGMSFEAGACLGVPACTAHFAVFADGRITGQTILIPGAAGAVGHYAVQFAKWSGATVIATVSSREKAEHARAGGADHVIDYRREDVVGRVKEMTDGQGVDRIVEVDFGANLAADAELIKPNGVIASYSSTRIPEPVLPYYPLAFKGVTLRLVQGYLIPPQHRRQAIEDIAAMSVEGSLQHAVARRYPLSQIAAAHEASERGEVIGNIVVTIG